MSAAAENDAMQAAPVRKPRFESLDALRGIAALIVVFHHCALVYSDRQFEPGFSTHAGSWRWVDLTPLRLLFAGHGAVMVFFALSGFVLFLTFDQSDHFQYKPYITKRIMRIYPPFAFAILLSAALYLLVRPLSIDKLSWWFNTRSWDVAPTPKIIAANLAMVDSPRYQTLDNVMWSLVPEIRISLIFPILAFCVRARWLSTLIGSTILSAICAYLSNKHVESWMIDPLQTLRYIYLFVAGASLSLNYKNVRSQILSMPVALRISLWILALVLITYPASRSLGFITGVAGVLLVALSFSDHNMERYLGHSFPTWLGRISYSLYLVHLLVLLTLTHMLYGRLSLPLILLLTVMSSLVLAEIMNRIVEQPSIRLGRRLAAHFSS